MVILSICSASPVAALDKSEFYLEPAGISRKDGCSLGECSSDNNQVILYPHFNCSKFCLCDWGHYYEMDCPKDLYFNSKTLNCDLPFKTNCTDLEFFLDSMRH